MIEANPYDDLVTGDIAEAARNANPYDSLIDQQRAGDVRSATMAAHGRNPDAYAKARQIAQRNGWPTDIVANDPAPFEQREEADRIEAAAKSNPALGTFLSVPGNVALAKDDTDNLSELVGSLSEKPKEQTFFRKVSESLFGPLIQSGRGKMLADNLDDVGATMGHSARSMIAAIDEWATESELDEARIYGTAARADHLEAVRAGDAARRAKESGAAASIVTKYADNSPGYHAMGIARSVPLMAGALLMRSPTMGAAAIGIGTAAEQRSQALADGATTAQATASGITHGALEGTLDMVTLGIARWGLAPVKQAIVARFGESVATRLMGAATATAPRRLAAAAAEGAITEIPTTVGQMASDELILGKEYSAADYARGVRDSAIQGAAMSAGAYAATAPLRAGTHFQATMTRLIDSTNDSKRLGTFTELAAKSKLGERSPADMETLVADVGEHEVYLSAEAAKVLFQSANVDPHEFAAQLTGNDRAWAEAEATGGDLTIPAAKWASIVARLPNANEFAKNARLQREGYSSVELDGLDVDEVLAETLGDNQATPVTPAHVASALQVEDQVRGMLTATGAYSAADSQRQAKLYGAVFGTLARRLDTDALSLFEPFGLEIERNTAKPLKRAALRVRDAAGKAGLATPLPTRTLPQQGKGEAGKGARGRLLIFSDNKMRIELLEKADLTTFLHESAHFFWEVFSTAAARDDAPQGIREDHAAALQWFGVESAADITDDHLEQWARGFERYIGEGKAPTPELQSLFSRFAAWLLDAYRDLSRLNVTINPEIRGVFGRLLAADDEIAAAESQSRPLDLGNEPKALGLSETKWADYVAITEAAAREGRAELASKVIQSQRRESDALRKEQREAIRVEIEREIDASPGVRAARILSGRTEIDGKPVPAEMRELKLDAATLAAVHGKEWVDANLKPIGVTASKGGIDPDTASALLGFPSGDALVKALAGAKAARASIDGETDARLAERHPLPEFDLDAAVTQSTNSDRRLDTIDAELGLLADLAKQPKPNRRQLRAVAVEVIARLPIRDIRPHVYLVAERRAARKAQRAAGRGDYAAALVSKRQQALNATLYSEASLVRETTERQVTYAHNLEGPTARKRFGKAGLLETLEQVLELYSFRAISDKQRDRTATLRGWYDRMLANGIDPQVPDAVMKQIDENRRTHYRDLAPNQLAEVVDVLKLLDHQAVEALDLRLAGDKLDLESAAVELSEGVRSALKDRGPPPASEALRKRFPQYATAKFRAAGALLLRMRTLAHWVDGEGNVDGPFHRMVIRPLDRTQAAYLDAMKTYGETVVDLFREHLGSEDLARPIAIASIRQQLTKSDILAVALNTGNASNLQRMQEGRGWGDVQMMEILGHMTKANWDFVQATWDTLETLWPQIAAQQQRLTGVEPPKVEAQPITTPFGKYRGGYYPLVYDRDSSEWRAFVNAETDSFFDPMAVTALPPSGHTKERVHRARLPVKLDLAVIPSHLSSILKDLTHRETVIGIRKLMKSSEVVEALNDTMGPEYLDMVEDKLRQVATDQVTQAGKSFGLVRNISRRVRRHVGIMAQGLSVTSGLKQAIGVSNSLEVMTARHGSRAAPLLLQAYVRMFTPGNTDAVMELSGEMRHRLNTADVDIRNAMDRYLTGKMKAGIKGAALRAYDGSIAHAYIFIRYAQTYLVDIPLWMAAHEGQLRSGVTGDAAIAAADDAVITAQGAGGAKDTALIEGNVPFLEWLTMFYSYGSAYLNRQVSMGRQIGKSVEGGPGRIAAELPLLSARALFLVALPVILDDLINQAAGSAEGPEEDEDLASYYGSRTVAYLFYGVPGLRDLASAKYGYKLSPAESVGSAYMRLAADGESLLGGEDLEARKVAKDALTAVGYTIGLPLAGPWRHVDYLWRVMEGEESPESVPEFAAAVAIAKREQR